jgi:predicted P-loop ATPase
MFDWLKKKVKELPEIMAKHKLNIIEENEAEDWTDRVQWIEIEDKESGEIRSYLPNDMDVMVEFVLNYPENFGKLTFDEATGLMFKDGKEIRTEQEMTAIITPIRLNLTANVYKFDSKKKNLMYDIVQEVAYRNTFNSHQDRIEEAYDWYKKYKTQEFRLGTYENVNENLLKWQFNQDNEMDNKQLRFWLALVARHTMHPHTYPIDFTLPIISTNESMASAQGAGKTTFLRWLAFDDVLDMDGFSTESWRKAGHKFMLIDDEAKLLKSTSIEAYKSAVTKDSIEVRYPYAHGESHLPMRYTMITANYNFLKDNTGNRRFPIIELSDVSGRVMQKSDMTDELRKAVWGQAMNDVESGWLAENYDEMYSFLVSKMDGRRELSEEEEALSLYVRYAANPDKLLKADSFDIMDYIKRGVPNYEEPVEYIYRAHLKDVMELLFGNKLTTNKITKLLGGLDEHYLAKLPAKDMGDFKMKNPDTNRQERVYRRRDTL